MSSLCLWLSVSQPNFQHAAVLSKNKKTPQQTAGTLGIQYINRITWKSVHVHSLMRTVHSYSLPKCDCVTVAIPFCHILTPILCICLQHKPFSINFKHDERQKDGGKSITRSRER